MQAGIAREHDVHHKIAVFKRHLAPNCLPQNLLLERTITKRSISLRLLEGGNGGNKRGNSNSARRGEDVAQASQPGKHMEHKLKLEAKSHPFQCIFLSHNWTNLEHHFYANASFSSRGNRWLEWGKLRDAWKRKTSQERLRKSFTFHKIIGVAYIWMIMQVCR